MKRLLPVLSMVALLSACVHGGAAPPNQDPRPQGQYWSTTSQACQEWPESI